MTASHFASLDVQKRRHATTICLGERAPLIPRAARPRENPRSAAQVRAADALPARIDLAPLTLVLARCLGRRVQAATPELPEAFEGDVQDPMQCFKSVTMIQCSLGQHGAAMATTASGVSSRL